MVRKILTAGVLLSIFAVLFLAASARSGSNSIVADNSSQPVRSQPAVNGRAEAELLVLRSDGFKPNEITRGPGRFLLAIQNHSSAEELSLVLQQESGASMRQVRMANRQSKLKEVLELPPGRYVLAEANHPQWTCPIVITPH